LKTALLCILISICFATVTFARWQIEQPSAVLGTHSWNLRVTDNDKAPRGMKFELHKAITFDRNEARTVGAYDKKSLGSQITDALGMLSFGEVKPGRYGSVTGESLSDSIAVEVTRPAADAPKKRLWLKYYDDGCLDVAVESLNPTSHANENRARCPNALTSRKS
jgi:hypothetical protein